VQKLAVKRKVRADDTKLIKNLNPQQNFAWGGKNSEFFVGSLKVKTTKNAYVVPLCGAPLKGLSYV
jgi:hypothetical protein